MSEHNACCARMVAVLVEEALNLLKGFSDELDLKRCGDASLAGNLTQAQRKQVAKIAGSLQEQEKYVSWVRTLLRAANLDEPFAPKAIERLFALSNLIRQITDPEDPGQVTRIRNELKQKLQELWEVTNEVINPHGIGGTGSPGEVVFNILLLTDFHWGALGCQNRWRDVQQRFFDALERACAAGNGFDLVVFSGDLAFSGKREEYDGPGSSAPKEFNGFLTELWTHLKQKCHCDPLLLTVPGNHDLRWPSSPDQLKLVEGLKNYADDEAVRKKVWVERDPAYWDLFRTAFADYLSWRTCNVGHQRDVDKRAPLKDFYQESDFPGGFSCRLWKDKKVLGIVGLNSAFLQLNEGDFEGMLAVESEQLHTACGGDGPKWLGANDANILVSHHPVSWLYPDYQKKFYNKVCIPDWIDVHLHGHLHDPDMLRLAYGGGNPINSIQGISLFGQKEYANPKTGNKFERLLHGYVFVQVRTTPLGNFLRSKPRVIAGHGGDVSASKDIVLNEGTGWTAWIETRKPPAVP